MQPSQGTRPNVQPQPARVIPRISTYDPQGQQTNLGNVRTANPTTIRQPPSEAISRPRTYNPPVVTQNDDDDLGVNLTSNRIESEPGRFDQATRAISPTELAQLKQGNAQNAPAKVNQRVEPPSNGTLARYGDVQEGQANNAPTR